MAEMEGAEYVKAEYVRRIHVSIPKVADDAIYPGELSLHKQLLLKGVIDALQSTGDPYLSFEDAYSSYAVVCEFRDREAEEESVVRSYIDDLHSDGYLLLRKVDGETFVGMEYPFDRLAQVLEGTLREALRHPC